MIHVTLLGTAATMPLPERALTSVFLSCCGHSILFDCGEGTQTAARKAHISLMKTELIALTHYHGDHIFGLPGLLQTMGCLGRKDPLYLMGPDGLNEAMGPIIAMAGELPFPVYALAPMERNASAGSTGFYSFSLSDHIPGWPAEASLTVFRTEHRVESCGYRFDLFRPGKFNAGTAESLGVPVKQWRILQHGEEVILDDGRVIRPEDVLGPERKGLRVVFSGDTSPCSSLTEMAHDADLLICDATYGDEEQKSQAEKYGHSTFSQAAETARDAGAKRLWLAHFSQMMEEPKDYLQNAQDYFPESICGEDGMSVRLAFTEKN